VHPGFRRDRVTCVWHPRTPLQARLAAGQLSRLADASPACSMIVWLVFLQDTFDHAAVGRVCSPPWVMVPDHEMRDNVHRTESHQGGTPPAGSRHGLALTPVTTSLLRGAGTHTVVLPAAIPRTPAGYACYGPDLLGNRWHRNSRGRWHDQIVILGELSR